MKRKLTEAYIDGIREGRKLWNSLPPETRSIDAPAHLANVEATMRTFSAGLTKDTLRGERDFWRAQIRRTAHT